jgi:hypothetical protein
MYPETGLPHLTCVPLMRTFWVATLSTAMYQPVSGWVEALGLHAGGRLQARM